MEAKQRRGRWLALGLVIGLIVAWGGFTVADAVIPAPGGVIKACYKKNGNLRVIDSAASCKPGKETAINWNQTGPRGATGPAGSTLFAVVDTGSSATLIRGRGVTSTLAVTPGAIRVTFDRSLNDCAATATPEPDLSSPFGPGVRTAEVFITDNVNSVDLQSKVNGNTTAMRVHLAVAC
jgi:hypothetical protein